MAIEDIRPIDANALIRKIKDGVWIQIEDGYGNAIGREKLNPAFAFVINEMPTIDAQPVKLGKWILVVERVMTNKYACSECDSVYAIPRELAPEGFYCYCPRCGADMRGEVDDKP